MKDEKEKQHPSQGRNESPTRKQEDGPGMDRTLDRSQNRDGYADPNVASDPDRNPALDPARKDETYPGPRREEDLENEREKKRDERRENDPEDDPREIPLEDPDADPRMPM